MTFHWTFRTPEEAGRHEFVFELVHPDGAAPAQGDAALRVAVEVVEEPRTETRRLRDLALEACVWSWLPGEGVSWSSGGPGYPMFAREARGCRITDLEGRQYVDYMMGWGCALLGYANERIQRAVADALTSGAVTTLGHRLMMEVAEMLLALFPGAGAVTFGKNGSDVCTAAVRLARAYTGRPVVLVCGYHGWQDWYAGPLGLAAAGVPAQGEPLALAYEYGNLEQLAALLDTHRGRVAAVMVEPAGCDNVAGPNQDADPAFLRELADLARRDGALVVFDEVFTGFRYPGGSVQRAVGVVPDLTCLGKALSAGMPLSALVGRKDVFQSSLGQIFYEPTFKGEAYSLAAAREALTIYQEQDVPAYVWAFGNRLREAVNRLCRELNAPARVVGMPLRMILTFDEEEKRRVVLMATLVQQELHRKGVLTYLNSLVPSLAHDDAALADTCRAFEHALRVLVEALDGDRFAAYLETPPLPV